MSALAVRGLTRRFADVVANADITCEIRQGEMFGLLGPNGAGKSTFVRQLMGLLRPDAGEITVLGEDVVRRPELAPRLAAYLAQDERAVAELSPRVAAHAVSDRSTTIPWRRRTRTAAVSAGPST